MKKNFAYSAFTQTLLMSLSTTALADTNVPQTTILDEITVVGSVDKVGNIDFVTPRSVQILTQENLAERGVRQLDEATRYEAGINSQLYGSDLDATDWLKIRGFDATVRLDGTALYKGGYFGWNPNIYGLEAVEIVKGADAIIYGSAQTGGLINLISKRPTHQQKGEINFTLGNRNERGIAGDINHIINDKLRVRLVGSYSKRDGEVRKTWQESYYFAPSLNWDITDKTNLTLLASIQKDVGVPTTSFFPSYKVLQAGNISPRTNYAENDHNFLNRTQSSLGYEINQQFDHGFTFSQNYKFTHSNSDQFVTGYGYMLSDNIADKSSTYANATAKSHTVDTRLSQKWENDRLHNTLTAGIDYTHHKVAGVYGFSSQTLSGIAGAYPYFMSAWSDANGNYTFYPYAFNVYRNNGASMPRPVVPVYQDKQQQTGLYLQDQLRVGDAFTVNLGLRRDFAKGNADSFGNKTHYNLAHTSYSANAIYMTELGLAPYMSYSESFRPISGNDGHTQYKPYQGKQYEVGIKYLPTFINGTMSIAYFDLTEKNALVNAATGGQSTQAGKQQSKGVEMQAELNLNEAISTTLAYSYTHAKLHTNNVVDTPAQPKHSYSALIHYAFNHNALAGLKIGAGIRHTGTTTDEKGNVGIKVPARTLVDVMAKYTISPNWEAKVNVTNLTNKKYIASCYYACYYGEGRKLSANVAYKF